MGGGQTYTRPFFREPRFEVLSGQGPDRPHPKVRVTEEDDALVTALRLSQQRGFGTVTEILAMPAELVLTMAEYADFLADYQRADMELNKPTP